MEKKEEGKTKRSILFKGQARVRTNGDIATVELKGSARSLGSRASLALVIIWSDEPSRHAAASGSVDGAVSITRAAGA